MTRVCSACVLERESADCVSWQEDDDDCEIVYDACMLDLPDDPLESMWVDVPIAGACVQPQAT